MNEPFLEFEWTVAPAYEWSDVLDEHGKPVVVPSEGRASLESSDAVELAWGRFELKGKGTGPVLFPVGEFSKYRQGRPIRREHAALFLIFAALDYRDREAIRAFAKTYGLLGVSSDGESHLTWAREICLMGKALKLGQPATAAVEAQDRAIWSKQGWGDADDLVEHRHRERREELAWLFNVHLQEVQARMTFALDVPPRLKFEPKSLLAAMWLQLALAVVGDKRFPACKFCRRLFEISTEQTGFRSHREFCSDSCKTKDYRRRKRTALQLATKRLSIREIAKATETESTTVRAWIASSKRRSTATKNSRRNWT